MKKIRNEQGGVVAFLVVGVLLASALLGGIYLAKQQGQIARSDAATEESQEIQKNVEENQSKTDKNTETSSQPASGPDSESSGEGTSTNSTESTSSQSVAVTGPSDVPSTGPEDTVAIVLVIATSVLGIWYYTASRRSLVRSALR